MKRFILFSAFASLLLSNSDCNEKKNGVAKYKGRLEVKGICSNYTVSVIEGNMDTAKIVGEWTDDASKKKYHNVFKPGNPCDFPASINQGDEFYFTIDTVKDKQCMVCMAYYPTPPKTILIKVLDK